MGAHLPPEVWKENIQLRLMYQALLDSAGRPSGHHAAFGEKKRNTVHTPRLLMIPTSIQPDPWKMDHVK